MHRGETGNKANALCKVAFLILKNQHVRHVTPIDNSDWSQYSVHLVIARSKIMCTCSMCSITIVIFVHYTAVV